MEIELSNGAALRGNDPDEEHADENDAHRSEASSTRTQETDASRSLKNIPYDSAPSGNHPGTAGFEYSLPAFMRPFELVIKVFY